MIKNQKEKNIFKNPIFERMVTVFFSYEVMSLENDAVHCVNLEINCVESNQYKYRWEYATITFILKVKHKKYSISIKSTSFPNCINSIIVLKELAAYKSK